LFFLLLFYTKRDRISTFDIHEDPSENEHAVAVAEEPVFLFDGSCVSLFDKFYGKHDRQIDINCRTASYKTGSSPQSRHRMRANPHFGLPQSRRRCEERSDVAICAPSMGVIYRVRAPSDEGSSSR